MGIEQLEPSRPEPRIPQTLRLVLSLFQMDCIMAQQGANLNQMSQVGPSALQ